MLDTNILIYLIKNNPPSVAARLDGLTQEDQLCMSFITYAELLKGAERSTKKSQVLATLAQLIRHIPVSYQTSSSLCEFWATHFTRLKAAGTPVGANDLWIASHALSIAATLVTHNTREFKRIPGLKLEDWV